MARGKWFFFIDPGNELSSVFDFFVRLKHQEIAGFPILKVRVRHRKYLMRHLSLMSVIIVDFDSFLFALFFKTHSWKLRKIYRGRKWSYRTRGMASSCVSIWCATYVSFICRFFLSLLVARFSWTISVLLSKITSYFKSAPAKTHTHYFILLQDTRLKYL